MVGSETPFFLTRGVILLPQDIMTGNWLQMASAARLTTIATHITPSQVTSFIRTPLCRCPQCKDLTDSEQTLILENALIKALRRLDPKATLAHLAYLNTLKAPVQIKPEPGIFLAYAPIRRRHDEPLRCREKDGDDPNTSHAAMLEALAGNLGVFGSEDAQVLEYWLDVSRFASWKREKTIAIPWHQHVFEQDLGTYASFGIRHITRFACRGDGDYITRFGEPPVQAYGEALWKF